MTHKNFIIDIQGKYACFTRPELSVEKYSYSVITPAAAKNILNSVYYKDQMRWVIDKIHIYNKPSFLNYKYNGILEKNNCKKGIDDFNYLISNENRVQLNATILKDVHYVIEAHIEMNKKYEINEQNNPIKHEQMALRRLEKGQFARCPFLGCREYTAEIELLDNVPLNEIEDFEIGPMAWGFNYFTKETIMFIPKMKNGTIIIPDLDPEGGN